MNFHAPDEDLLMLTHDTLPWGQKIATQVHIVLCAACRTRVEKLEGASRLIADTIRGRDLPRWRQATAQGTVVAARLAVVWLTTFALLLTLSLAAVIHATRQHSLSQAHVLHTPMPTKGGCRPDLPSDQCR